MTTLTIPHPKTNLGDSARSTFPARSALIKSGALRCAVGLFVVAGATVVKLLLDPFLGPESPYLLYAAAVMIAAWYGGVVAGLFATIAFSLVIDFIFVEPRAHWSAPGFARADLQFFLFASEALFVSWITGALVRSRELLRRSEETARERAAELEAVMTVVPAAILVAHDPDCRHIAGNAAAQRLLADAGAIAPDVVAGRTAGMNGEPPFVLAQPLVEAVADGAGGRYREIEVRTASGAARTLFGCASPLRRAGGMVSGAVGAFLDITELKQIERELSRHRNQLEELVAERTTALKQSMEQLRHSERLASMGTVAAGIAHEINNPLGAILLAARSALRHKKNDVTESALQLICEEAERAGNITRGILKFAKADTSRKSPGDLNAVVRHAVELSQVYLHGGNAAIECNLEESLAPVAMNATEIEQVLVNLIKNAAEATLNPVRITIATCAAEGVVRLTVEDDGPGIRREHLPKIFDPFFTTKRQTGGTGLGLSICHGIVADHGGALTVESEIARGTRFTIELPSAG